MSKICTATAQSAGQLTVLRVLVRVQSLLALFNILWTMPAVLHDVNCRHLDSCTVNLAF